MYVRRDDDVVGLDDYYYYEKEDGGGPNMPHRPSSNIAKHSIEKYLLLLYY